MENNKQLETLNRIIENYYDHKVEFDACKNICDDENKKIKEEMLELEMDKICVGDITATRSVSVKESFNEDKLINLLEHSTYTNPDTGVKNILISTGLNIVKMKPYIDMDALEDALYKGLIPEDVILMMEDCKEVKEVVTLRVTKKKKKENRNDD